MRISFILVLTLLTQISFATTPSLMAAAKFKIATDANPQVQGSESDLWSDVAVNINWLLANVNARDCARSTKVYVGCALAVQTLATALNKNLEVIPVAQLGIKKPFYQAERLALVEMPLPVIATPKDAYEHFEKMRALMNARFAVSSIAFMKSPNLDFEQLISEIYKRAQAKISVKIIVAAAGKFIETALDPHTSVQPTKAMQQSSSQSGDSFVGIGVEVMALDSGLMVKKTTKGSGAEKAGMLPGDIIVGVDGTPIKGMKQDDVVSKLRGVDGTTVNVTFVREEKTLTISVARAKIVSPVLSSEGISFNGKTYAYIHLTNFMYDQICEELGKIITTWENQKVDGYILDLRSNPGGDVKIAGCVGGAFLGANKIVTYFEQQSTVGSRYKPLMTTAKVSTNKPLSVLINSYSASASEIVSGAIRDYNRGYIVGQTSFGKGSYQGCRPLPGNEALVMCSTGGLFFAPSGITNQATGIEPHVSVYLEKEQQESEKFALREAQLYLYPLTPKKMPSTPSGNWNQLKAPTECLAKQNLAEKYTQLTAISLFYKDYQLLNAVAAVNCAK